MGNNDIQELDTRAHSEMILPHRVIYVLITDMVSITENLEYVYYSVIDRISLRIRDTDSTVHISKSIDYRNVHVYLLLDLLVRVIHALYQI